MSPETQPQDPSSLAYLRRRRYARTCVLRLLYQADMNDQWQYTVQELQRFWEQNASLDDLLIGTDYMAAREYAMRLIEGVLAHHAELDAQIAACAHNWRLGRMSVVDRNLLRLSAYEILFGAEVPPAVAINEAIELAKEFGDKDSSRFVNGVLDRLAKPSGGEAPAADAAG